MHAFFYVYDLLEVLYITHAALLYRGPALLFSLARREKKQKTRG